MKIAYAAENKETGKAFKDILENYFKKRQIDANIYLFIYFPAGTNQKYGGRNT